jgi:hypothetical protein
MSYGQWHKSYILFLFVHLDIILNYNFACGSVWVWYLVYDIKGGEMKWREVGENYIMKSFITCTLLQV